MKLLALLALIPAISVQVVARPNPGPEAYNPFFPSPNTLNSTLSTNPISHGNLNSRAQIVAKAPAYHATNKDKDGGVKQHKKSRMVKKSLRKVKRQNASCVPASTGTGTGTGAGTSTGTATTATQKTTTNGQGTTSTTPSPSPSPTTTKAATTSTTSTTAAQPQTTNFTVDPDGNGPFKGMATYYDTDVGYGSCGVWHKNWEPTVALSRELMDNWPGYNGLNPNNNPICGQKLQLNYGGKTLIAEVQDTCPGCTKRWIDVSQGIFEYFADTSVGMLGVDGYTPGFTWQWVDINTPLTSLPH